MELLGRKDEVNDRTEREMLARILLSVSELPILVRARCHMVLSSGKINQIWHAQQAIRVLRSVLETYGHRGEEDDSLLKLVKKLSAKAEQFGGEDEGDE